MPALSLAGRFSPTWNADVFVARASRGVGGSVTERSREVYLLGDGERSVPEDFLAGLATSGDVDRSAAAGGPRAIRIPSELGYLAQGDVVRVNPRAGEIRVLYRKSSPFNALLVTERCNSRCVMCSQPPRDEDDSHLVDEIVRAIELMSPETPELGLTGGEPTLLHDGFLRILETARDRLPSTALHVLSNGRLLAYLPYAERLAAIGHPDLMLGIPVYSDVPRTHDFVVQARGAFDETIRGILNLGRVGVRIEIRVVLHRHTVDRLARLGEFIARNLPFVEHVALMGLEPMGYARMNFEALWIDPIEYRSQLAKCVSAMTGVVGRVSIYNHQLCTLDRELWPYARRSISDWKNVYLPLCDGCAARGDCGGFFASATRRHSVAISPISGAGAAQRTPGTSNCPGLPGTDTMT